MLLKNKVALITGSARGLGKGFANAILDAGGKVCLCDLLKEEGLKSLSQFQRTYGSDRVIFVYCDVTDHQSLQNVFKKTLESFGRLDIVINNAGIALEDNVRKTMMVNVIGVIEGTQLATKYMNKKAGGNGGVVVNVASTAGLTPVFVSPVYVASKYSVVGYTRSVAQNPENPAQGIRYTCLCPAFTATDMFNNQNHGNLDIIKNTGVNRVEDVVKGLMELLESENNNGAVMTVTKHHGIQYRHGKPLSHKL